MRGLRRAARLTAPVLLVTGLLALAYVAYVVIDAEAYQAIEHRRLADPRPLVTVGSARTPLLAIEGRAIGEIESRRIGLRAVVAQGESPAVLQHAVGHLEDTALPGEPGNVVLAGHRDTFFRPLKRIRVGDTIALTTERGYFEYLVESITVVPPSDTSVIQPTSRQTLTLITCFPFSYIGPAPDRFVVRARYIAAARDDAVR